MSKREKRFFHLVTMFTMSWSRAKPFFFCSTFQLYIHYGHYGHKKKKLIFIAPLPWLRYDYEKLFFILLLRLVCKYLFTSHYVVNLSKKSPNDILSGKQWLLKNFPPQEFQWFTSRQGALKSNHCLKSHLQYDVKKLAVPGNSNLKAQQKKTVKNCYILFS